MVFWIFAFSNPTHRHIDARHIRATLPLREHCHELDRLQAGPHDAAQRHAIGRGIRLVHAVADGGRSGRTVGGVLARLVLGTPVRQARLHGGAALGLPAHLAGSIVRRVAGAGLLVAVGGVGGGAGISVGCMVWRMD